MPKPWSCGWMKESKSHIQTASSESAARSQCHLAKVGARVHPAMAPSSQGNICSARRVDHPREAKRIKSSHKWSSNRIATNRWAEEGLRAMRCTKGPCGLEYEQVRSLLDEDKCGHRWETSYRARSSLSEAYLCILLLARLPANIPKNQKDLEISKAIRRFGRIMEDRIRRT